MGAYSSWYNNFIIHYHDQNLFSTYAFHSLHNSLVHISHTKYFHTEWSK